MIHIEKVKSGISYLIAAEVFMVLSLVGSLNVFAAIPGWVWFFNLLSIPAFCFVVIAAVLMRKENALFKKVFIMSLIGIVLSIALLIFGCCSTNNTACANLRVVTQILIYILTVAMISLLIKGINLFADGIEKLGRATYTLYIVGIVITVIVNILFCIKQVTGNQAAAYSLTIVSIVFSLLAFVSFIIYLVKAKRKINKELKEN